MKKLITMIAIILMMTIGAISAYGAQDSAVADEPLLLPEATVFIPGLPEGVSLTMTNVYNYYMEHSSDGNPIYWIIVQRGGTVSSNTELRKVFQYIYPNGGGYKPGDPSVVVRPQEPDDVNRVTSGSLLLYYTPENSNYQIRVAIFCVDSIDVGDNSFWRFANLSGGELGQGGIKPLSKLFSEPLKSSDVATTQFGAANDGVVFPKKSNNRVPADAAPYIYFGAYDHISRLEQPTSNRSATTYTQADIKREGFVSPILWQVDDVSFENDRISLSSEYVIDTHVFNGAASSGNDYRTSDIRTWLNGDFITQAFASEESGAILPTDVEIKLYDFNSLPLREVEPAETSRIAYGDKVYLPDMPSDGAPLFQKDNGNKGAMTWTRTWTTATQAASGDHAFSSMLGTNGTATVTTNRGIAPLTALKYSSVLYLSEISAMAGQGKTVADAKNYRLPFTE
ncbi:MAG: DUF6273 domain-containing protein, partial [Clostridiales bacterium]|nr:DUF6273 domain-containing protein [Clostridiales bacterium]